MSEQNIVPPTLSQRRAKVPAALVWYRWSLPATICLCAALAMAVLFGVFAWNARITKQMMADIQGAPLRQGTAELIRKEVLPGTSRSTVLNTTYTYLFKIDGHTAAFATYDGSKFPYVRDGDRVPVAYRIGRSGSYYVEDWQLARR